MIHVLSKFLPVFLFPAGLVLVLAVPGLILLWRGRLRAAKGFLLSAFLLLFVFSSPITAHTLLRGLERGYPQAATGPAASAIVVMGGAGVPALEPRVHPETNAFADRIFHGARLFRQGRAPRLVVTGGKIKFLKDFPGSEAAINAALLREILPPPGGDSVFLADSSMNTREDAAAVARLLEAKGLPKDILLVTSAAHMARSLGVFRKLGFNVHPEPTDYHADGSFDFKIFHLLPREGALYESWYALHEYYGLLAYRLLGWI